MSTESGIILGLLSQSQKLAIVDADGSLNPLHLGAQHQGLVGGLGRHGVPRRMCLNLDQLIEFKGFSAVVNPFFLFTYCVVGTIAFFSFAFVTVSPESAIRRAGLSKKVKKAPPPVVFSVALLYRQGLLGIG